MGLGELPSKLLGFRARDLEAGSFNRVLVRGVLVRGYVWVTWVLQL